RPEQRRKRFEPQLGALSRLTTRSFSLSGVTLLIDCAGIGMSSLDLDLLKFIVTSFSQYYPKLFDAIIIHELPFLLQYVFRLIQSWLPEDDRKFFHLTNKKTLTDFVAPSQLPSFLSGTNPDSWRQVPDQVVPARELVRHHAA